MQLTNTQARRITIAGQDIDPGKTSKPIQVIKAGKLDQAATDNLVEKVKRSPLYVARWLVEGPVTMPPAQSVPKPTSLVAEDDSKALTWVRLEDDLATLAAWAESENKAGKRKAVLDAIGARAAAINNHKG